MPPVTEAHLRAALALFAWPGWTLDAALSDPLRGRILRARAAQLRTQEWQRTHRPALTYTRRCTADGQRWVTQRLQGRFDEAQASMDLTA